MGFFIKSFCLFFFLWHTLPATLTPEKKGIIYFQAQKNSFTDAILKYQQAAKNKHDFEVLQDLCYLILQQGIQNKDPLLQKISLFSAGMVATNSRSIALLEHGLLSQDQEAQLTALHFLSLHKEDRVLEIFSEAMSSPFLAVRMEAAYHMVMAKHPKIQGHLESLMHRLPPQFKPYFPFYFAALQTFESHRELKKLLYDENPLVRSESILHIAHNQIDELLPFLRSKCGQGTLAEEETLCFALGLLKDSKSLIKLQQVASKADDSLAMAAHYARYRLGDIGAKEDLFMLAKNNHLPTIALLSHLPESSDLLCSLLQSPDRNVKANAAIALLLQKNPHCLKALVELLIIDEKDLCLQPAYSRGRTQLYWKVISNVSQRKKDPFINPSLGLPIREYLLQEALNLPERDFLQLAQTLFTYHQHDLFPTLMRLLETLKTPEAIALLKKASNAIGAPFLRDYANLALYRMEVKGPYEEYIIKWVLDKKEHSKLSLRELHPHHQRITPTFYELTAQETSQLLIDMYVAIAQKKDTFAIDTLLEAMRLHSEEKVYLLAGILLASIE